MTPIASNLPGALGVRPAAGGPSPTISAACDAVMMAGTLVTVRSPGAPGTGSPRCSRTPPASIPAGSISVNAAKTAGCDNSPSDSKGAADARASDLRVGVFGTRKLTARRRPRNAGREQEQVAPHARQPEPPTPSARNPPPSTRTCHNPNVRTPAPGPEWASATALVSEKAGTDTKGREEQAARTTRTSSGAVRRRARRIRRGDWRDEVTRRRHGKLIGPVGRMNGASRSPARSARR